MSQGRITVSLPMRQIEAAKRAVAEGRAETVSAYVSDALDTAYDSWAALAADLTAEFGPTPPEARAWAQAVWADAKRLAEGRTE